MKWFGFAGLLLFGALPSTATYKLNSYGFGSGGTSNSFTSTYSLEGTVGEVSGQPSSTSTNGVKPGFIQTEQAHVPKLSALDNNSGQYYNKLHYLIDNQGNPSDATFLISVSTDNFSTDIKYLQTDGTLSSTLLLADYQTYNAGGGLIIGLLPSQTYYVRVRATQGKFTESAYGPVSNVATAAPSLTFSLSTTAATPYTVGFGLLAAGSVTTATDTISTSLTTNGTSGGDVYINGRNGGLLSNSTGYKINAVTNDLANVSEGFGVQLKAGSITQTSGGPFVVKSPYNVTGTNVGVVSSTTRSLFSSTTPITGGSGSLVLEAKSATTDVAATDYQEILTFTAAGNF